MGGRIVCVERLNIRRRGLQGEQLTMREQRRRDKKQRRVVEGGDRSVGVSLAC